MLLCRKDFAAASKGLISCYNNNCRLIILTAYKVNKRSVVMTEQRDYRRINFLTEADITVDDTVYHCDLVDLTLQGALFKSDPELPLSLGREVPFNIYLSETAVRLKFVGELIHHRGHFYGFIFTAEDPESMGHLRHLLELNFSHAEQVEGESSLWLERGSVD
jgi:hypothetical protein